MRKMFTFSSICMHSSHMNCSSSSTAPWKKSAWNSSSLVTIQFLFNFVFYLVPCDVRSLVTLFSLSRSLARWLFFPPFCALSSSSTLLHECCSCRITASDVHLARVYISLCVGVYTGARERKSKRVKKKTQTQQRINVITIKDHHSRSSSSSFSERRDNFWTLFQALD